MRSISGILLCVALAYPAHAAVEPAKTESAARASEGATEETITTATDEKVICRRDKTVGSRLSAQRICLTPRQWAERIREDRMRVEQGQNQRTFTGG